MRLIFIIIGTAGIVMRAGCVTETELRLSVCPIRPPYAAAAGLLLWARRVEDIDRLLHGRRENAGSAMLSADV